MVLRGSIDYLGGSFEPYVAKQRKLSGGMPNIGTTNNGEITDFDSQHGSTAVNSDDEAVTALKKVSLDLPMGPNGVDEVVLEGEELPSSRPKRFWEGREVDIDIIKPSDLHTVAPASTRLRHMIKYLDRIIMCPGVYDGLSARIAHQVGFDGMYMTGAGTTASKLGMADLGIATLNDMKQNAEMIANLVPEGAPLIADMDTGYGGPVVIARALQQYVTAGVAGFHIEDQILQKRCGHLQGKEVVDIESYITRIKACVVARQHLHSDIVIIARTDALQSKGYDDCIARLRKARDEGADMGILEGFQSKAQARQAVIDMAPWPLCLNSVENGVSPLISAGEAQEMGFRTIIFSFASLAPAYSSIKNTFEWLKAEGVTGTASSVTPKMIFQVCGLKDSMFIDEAAGGSAFVKGI
ncbi:hypothetical protein MMC21_006841 [Puttea exsequens]|nr:hypothetical protein [Puttea exsequens]